MVSTQGGFGVCLKIEPQVSVIAEIDLAGSLDDPVQILQIALAKQPVIMLFCLAKQPVYFTLYA